MRGIASIFGASVFLFLVADPRPLQSQEPQEPPLRTEYGRPAAEMKKGEFFLDGGVRVWREGGDFEFRADRVLLWMSEKNPDLPQELYAQGNVTYRRGTNVLAADELYFDAATNRLYASHVNITVDDPAVERPFYVKAEHLRGRAKGEMRLEGVTMTTCRYGVPHYDLSSDGIALAGSREHVPESAYDFFPFDEWKVETSGMSLRYSEVPLVPVPSTAFDVPGSTGFSLSSVRAGRSSRFGTFGLLDWRLGLRKGDADALNPWDDGDTSDDSDRWGKLTAETDWRQERGGAYGLDLETRSGSSYVTLDTYYLHDLGRNTHSDFDLKFGELRHADRGRARYFQRLDLDERWRAEAEVSYLSDRDLLEEFFPREFKDGKEAESAAYVRYRHENYAASLLEQHRLNDFQTQTESLPRAESHWLVEPIEIDGAPFAYWTQRTEVAHLRQRTDEDLTQVTASLWRFDAYEELQAPLATPVAVVTPLGSLRSTLFEDDLEGRTELRHLWTAGARATETVQGVHDLTWDDVGLRRLRHLIQFDARITSNLHSTAETDDLHRFDEVDRLDTFEEVALGMWHRFQTKDGQGGEVEFLNAALEAEYYPNAHRDTRAASDTNLYETYNWIVLAPGERGTFEARDWSNLHYRLDFTPRNLVSASARGEYNPGDRREEVREIGLGLDPSPDFSLSAKQVRISGVTEAVGGDCFVRLTPKWSFTGSLLYDHRQAEYLSRRLVLGRDVHDFVIEANIERNDARDDLRFYVTLVPKFFGRKGRRYEAIAD